MLDKEILDDLIESKLENSWIDFKGECGGGYFTNIESFAEDIMAMFNTSSDGQLYPSYSYIILTGFNSIKQAKAFDDARLSSELPKYLTVTPSISFSALETKDHKFVVLISIFKSRSIGPAALLKSTKKHNKGIVLHRSGSTNAVASVLECQRIANAFTNTQESIWRPLETRNAIDIFRDKIKRLNFIHEKPGDDLSSTISLLQDQYFVVLVGGEKLKSNDIDVDLRICINSVLDKDRNVVLPNIKSEKEDEKDDEMEKFKLAIIPNSREGTVRWHEDILKFKLKKRPALAILLLECDIVTDKAMEILKDLVLGACALDKLCLLFVIKDKPSFFRLRVEHDYFATDEMQCVNVHDFLSGIVAKPEAIEETVPDTTVLTYKSLEKYVGRVSILDKEKITESIIRGKDIDLAYVNQLPIIFKSQANDSAFNIVKAIQNDGSFRSFIFAPPFSGGTVFSRQLLCHIVDTAREFYTDKNGLKVNGYWCRGKPDKLPLCSPGEYQIIVFESLKREYITIPARTSIINIYSSCSVMKDDERLSVILSEDQGEKLRIFLCNLKPDITLAAKFNSLRGFSCILLEATENHISVRRFPMSCLLRLIKPIDRKLLAKISLCYLLSTSTIQLDEKMYWDLFTLQAKLETDHFLPRIRNKIYAEGLIRSWTFAEDEDCLSNLDECVKDSLADNEDKQNLWHQMNDKDIRKLLKLVVDVYADMVEHKTLDPSSPIKTSYLCSNASPKSRALTLDFINDRPPPSLTVLESIDYIIERLKGKEDEIRNIVSLLHAFALSYPSEGKKSVELLDKIYPLVVISKWSDLPEDVITMALNIHLFEGSSTIEDVKAILKEIPMSPSSSEVITTMINKADRLVS